MDYKKMPKMPHKDNRNPYIHKVLNRFDVLWVEHQYGEYRTAPINTNFVCFDCEIGFRKPVKPIQLQSNFTCTRCSKELIDLGTITRIPRKGSSAWKNFKRHYEKNKW